jgi:GT2 family glycosyltransferase
LTGEVSRSATTREYAGAAIASPHFSIIIPAYRAPDTIRVSLDSVLGQTVTDLEVVVVDDGSGDRTPEVVREYAERDARIRLIEQENAGTAAARNTGVAAATGHNISFLDNDDAWVSTYLESVQATFASHRDAGMAYADAWPFDDATGRILRRTALECYPPVAPNGSGTLLALLHRNFITASSVTVTREALERVGPFHTGMTGSDDWDMWLRITGSGLRAVRAGTRPQVMLREHAYSQSKDDLWMRRGAYRVIEAAVGRLSPDSEERRVAERTLARLGSELWELDGAPPIRHRAARARLALARWRARLLWRRRWLPPTAEVIAAFPPIRDLGRRR